MIPSAVGALRGQLAAFCTKVRSLPKPALYTSREGAAIFCRVLPPLAVAALHDRAFGPVSRPPHSRVCNYRHCLFYFAERPLTVHTDEEGWAGVGSFLLLGDPHLRDFLGWDVCGSQMVVDVLFGGVSSQAIDYERLGPLASESVGKDQRLKPLSYRGPENQFLWFLLVPFGFLSGFVECMGANV